MSELDLEVPEEHGRTFGRTFGLMVLGRIYSWAGAHWGKEA